VRVPGRRFRILLLVLLPVLGLLAVWVGRHAWGLWQLSAAQEALGRRDWPRARACLDACLRLWPEDPETTLLAAQAARRAGDLPEALRLLAAYRKLPGLPEAADLESHFAKLQLGDPEGAERDLAFCRAHPNHPQTPLVLEALILGALVANDPGRALRALDLWDSKPTGPADVAQGLLWRGEALKRMGDPDGALSAYRKAVATGALGDVAELRLAEMLVRQEPREALSLLQGLEGKHHPGPEVPLLLARCRRNLGDLDESGRLLDRLLSDAPDSVPALLERGQLYLDQRQPEQAERVLRRAAELAPELRETNLSLARCLRQAGKEAEAKPFEERFARIDADLTRRAQQILQGGGK
jgi:tetratricopeptide (TPR) repeat protein